MLSLHTEDPDDAPAAAGDGWLERETRRRQTLLRAMSILLRVTDNNGLDCVNRIVNYGVEAGTLDHIKRKYGLEYKPNMMLAKVTSEAHHIVDVMLTYAEALNEIQAHVTNNNAAVVEAVDKAIRKLCATHPEAEDIKGTEEVAGFLLMISLDQIETRQLITALQQYLEQRRPTAHEAFEHLGNFLAHAVRTSSSLFAAHMHPTLQRPGVAASQRPILRTFSGYNHKGHQRELYWSSVADQVAGHQGHHRASAAAAPHVPRNAAISVHPERALRSPILQRQTLPKADGLKDKASKKRDSPRMPRHGKLKARLGKIVKKRGGIASKYRRYQDLGRLCSVYHLHGECPYGTGRHCEVNGKRYSHVCPCGKRHPLIECKRACADDAYGAEQKRDERGHHKKRK